MDQDEKEETTIDVNSTSRKRQRQTTGSQTDEDCHCCDASTSISKLEAKIDKLLGLFSEIASLKKRLTEVEEENKDLKKAAENTEKDLNDLKTCVVSLSSQSETDNQELKELNKDILQLNCRNIKLEAYTRRESIKIFNLQEIEGETPRDTED